LARRAKGKTRVQGKRGRGKTRGKGKTPKIKTLNEIGFLYSSTKKSLRKQFNAFYDGLKKTGFIDGHDGHIEHRLADDDYGKLHNDAEDLVKRPNVKVIVAAGGPISAVEAKSARDKFKPSLPIVFTTIAEPEKYNLLTDRAHPDKNATGTAGLTTELDVKRLELLKELVPKVTRVGVLVNPNRPRQPEQTADLVKAAETIDRNLQLVIAKASTKQELGDAYHKLDEPPGVDALLVTADPFFNSERGEVIKVAEKLKRPAIYQWREFAEAGGLMSYGPSLAEAYNQAGNYAGLIFRGSHTPNNLPVVQPDRDELKPVINLKTAKNLPLDIPLSLLGRSELINEKE
jgi:putative ABC transport system substrate-binding protein